MLCMKLICGGLSAQNRARLVGVSSITHRGCKSLDVTDLQKYHQIKRSYGVVERLIIKSWSCSVVHL